MKLAVLADIHANLRAFEAVLYDIDAWQPDKVIVAGDTVNRGPLPCECWLRVQERIQSQGWHVITGNHEEYILEWAAPNTRPTGPLADIYQPTAWTVEQLNEHVDELRELSAEYSFIGPDGGEVRVRHGSMLGSSAGIFPKSSEDDIRRKMSPPPAVFLVAHTHRPLVKKVDDTLIVNVGAVGLPFDGDKRAGYARLTKQNGNWQPEIVRVNYNYDQAMEDLRISGFNPESGPLGDLIRIELLESRSQLFQWGVLFEERVLAGELSVGQAVTEFISNP